MLSKNVEYVVERAEKGRAGPARNIITGRRNHPVGLYYSVKNGRGIQWESRNELHKLYLAEVSSDVLRYQSLPEKLSVTINGCKRPYTPDLKEVMSDGRMVISEIKEDADDLDAGYRQKLEYVADYYKASGITFRIIDRKDIENDPCFEASETIQLFGRTVVTAADEKLARDMLSGGKEVALWELRDRYKTIPLGFGKICGMVVRRIITFDLTKKLDPRTPIHLVQNS